MLEQVALLRPDFLGVRELKLAVLRKNIIGFHAGISSSLERYIREESPDRGVTTFGWPNSQLRRILRTTGD